jgi:hypothetical protein
MSSRSVSNMNIRTIIITALLAFIAFGSSNAEPSRLPKVVPNGWQFKCSVVVFTETHLTTTTIESTGACTFSQGTIGGGDSTNLIHHLSLEAVNEIYQLAYDTICTFEPTKRFPTYEPIKSNIINEVFQNYVCTSVRIGPDSKNGFTVSAFGTTETLKNCHFSRILQLIGKFKTQSSGTVK